MSTGNDGEHVAHVDKAKIEVDKAELWISPGARRAAHRLTYACVVLFVFVLAMLGVVLSWTASQSDVNACQRVVNSRFQQADIDKADATKISAEAQITLWNALLGLHGTQAQKRAEFGAAFSRYKAALHGVTAIAYPARTGTEACNG
jgi:hypothetical protein